MRINYIYILCIRSIFGFWMFQNIKYFTYKIFHHHLIVVWVIHFEMDSDQAIIHWLSVDGLIYPMVPQLTLMDVVLFIKTFCHPQGHRIKAQVERPLVYFIIKTCCGINFTGTTLNNTWIINQPMFIWICIFVIMDLFASILKLRMTWTFKTSEQVNCCVKWWVLNA